MHIYIHGRLSDLYNFQVYGSRIFCIRLGKLSTVFTSGKYEI